MEKKLIDIELLDEMSSCINQVEEFFNLLLCADFDDLIPTRIAQTGKTLVDDVHRRIDEVCGIIETNLGKIEIQEDCDYVPLHARGRMVGVKFTLGEVLRRSLQNKGLNEGFSIEIQREG